MSSPLHKKLAFTLLELLVAVSIIMISIVGSIAGYTRYIERQQFIGTVEKIISGYRQAQNMITIGELGSCEEVDWVAFSLYLHATDGLSYRISKHCLGDAEAFYKNENIVDTNLGLNYELDSDLWSLKLYPYGYLSSSEERRLFSTKINYSALIEIDQGGHMKVTYQ